MKLILVGDVVTEKPFSFGSNLTQLFEDAFVCANLEGPILNPDSLPTPRKKAGPQVYSDLSNWRGRFQLVNLANNHLMDYGKPGLKQTMNLLQQDHIISLGAGTSLDQARASQIVSVDDKKIGLVAFTESQYGGVRRHQPGVAEFGPWVYQAINELRSQVDFLIVSAHMGPELSRLPAPFQQDLYRSFIAAGANLVWGHHSHVPQPFEKYQSGSIFYGLGNFIVDPTRWSDIALAAESIIIEVDIQTNKVTPRCTSIRLSDNSLEIELVESLSEPIETNILQDREFLESFWHSFSLKAYDTYYHSYIRDTKLPPSKIGKLITAYNSKPIDEATYRLWYHLFACQTHHHAIATALGIKSGEISYQPNKQVEKYISKYMPWVG